MKLSTLLSTPSMVEPASSGFQPLLSKKLAVSCFPPR